MAYEARCGKCGDQLFDVPDYQAFSEKRPVTLTCRGCGTVYIIIHKDGTVYFREKGTPASDNIEANKYG